ncbi:MAG TPA: ABC transporter permease, partial [Candidatus Polarisedimenticolia bacterium]|nr:ABC transporter permease [Candidatus Polarisedimenticolia bacterium]
MIRWRKVGVVAGFEFRSETRRISYLIMVFGMPLFMLAYGGFIGLFSLISKRSGEGAKVYGVVDRSGLLALTGDLSREAAPAPPELRHAMERMPSSAGAAATAFGEVIVFRPFAGEAEAMGALQDKSIRGWFLLAEDYLESGRVDRYVADGVALGSGRVERVFRALLTERLLAGRVADQVAARVLDPMDGGGSFTVGPDGKVSARSKLSIVAAIVVPLGFGILLFFAVFGTATTLIQGTATEKENRVVEILLSSARPD